MPEVMEKDNKKYDSSAHRSTAVIDGCYFAYE